MRDSERIIRALDIAIKYGGIDGSHHKTWVIDQMVRALTGCPIETRRGRDCNGDPYMYEEQGESPEYTELVRETCDGEDGPDTYKWETGTPP